VSLPNRGLAGKKIDSKNEGVFTVEAFSQDTPFIMMIIT
jgi:hypothetical protein